MRIQASKPIHYVTTVVVILSTLSGCASLNKQECLNANWRTIGFEDGSRGYPASRIGSHRSACAEHGIAPDLAAYTAGHEQGLQQFCTPRNGYLVGLRGQQHANLCPDQLQPAFREANDYGMGIYQLERDFGQLRQTDKSLSNDIAAIDQKIEVINAKLSNRDNHNPRNSTIEAEIRQLKDQYQRLKFQSNQYLNIQPYKRRGNEFKKHLQSDINKYKQMNQELFNHITDHFRLNPTQKSQLHNIYTYAQHRGTYLELQSWLELTNDGAPANMDNKRTVAAVLHQSSAKLRQSEDSLYIQMNNPALRIKINQLKSDQEFLGALSLHLHTLTHFHRQETLNQLINFHFTTAMMATDTRIGYLQARVHRHSVNTSSQIYQDLAQLEDEKEVLQFSLRENHQEQKRLQDHINALKASSPYR